MSVQRWGMDYEYEGLVTHPAGKYVTYADHVAALAEAEQRVRDEVNNHWRKYGGIRYRNALTDAREAVESLPRIGGGSGVNRAEALTAIDALAARQAPAARED